MTHSDRGSEVDAPLGYFGPLAEDYAAFRPTYADAAFDAMLAGLPAPVRAADVGCGTGIAARQLAARGIDHVIGIEPNTGMIEQARRHPQADGHITYRTGRAEQTGLNDGGVDLVLCAQAFHWFEPRPALVEFHRILRPGGRLALMWNHRDGSTSTFDAVLADITRQAQDFTESRGRVLQRHRDFDLTDYGDLFTNPRRLVFANPQAVDRAGLLGRFRSASYHPPIGTPLRAELDARLEALFDQWADDSGQVTIAQNTELTLADHVS